MDDRLTVGRLRAAHGLRGFLWVHSLTTPPQNVFAYGPWSLRHGEMDKSVEVEQWRPQGKGWLVKLRGVDDRNAADLLVGCEVLVPRSALPQLPEDEYYWSELIDMRVVTVAGSDLGCVHAMMETGANDVLVVRGDALSIDQRERLLPWLPGTVVHQVDRQARRIIVDWDADF